MRFPESFALSHDVQLLHMFSEGQHSAESAYSFLQSIPGLAMLHDASDLNQRTVPGAAADMVVLDEPLVWNQAPSVNTMVLPEVRPELLPEFAAACRSKASVAG